MAVNVGVSELPGRTFGIMQTMSNEQAGYNLVAALAELKRDYGIVVTVNEGDRPRPVQLALRRAWLAFQNGTGPWAALAAYCTDSPPPGVYTSTHDPINYGNASDLGMAGGGVITDRARNLLDGNHPDGVIGRKYGLYNTGWNFSTRERWHFNTYPERAQVLAPNPGTSAAKPTKPGTSPATDEEESAVKVIQAGSYKVLIGANGTWKIDKLKVAGQTFTGSQVAALLERVEASTAADRAKFNDLEFAVIRAALKKIK